MKEISLENWIQEGHGFTADSYRHKDDENLLLKLYYTAGGERSAEEEYRRAVDVAAMGIPTPKIYELVKADGKPGILFERIEHKRSFGRLVCDDPAGLPEYARIFAEHSKILHNTKCNTASFPDQKKVAEQLVRESDIRDEIKNFLFELLDNTEDRDTCVHGDLQTGNMVMGWCSGYEGRHRNEGEADKCYFIDLGDFAYGDPVFDISELYMSTQIYKTEPSNLEILHMTTEQLDEFWKNYAPAYIGTDDPQAIKEFEDHVAPYAIFFMLLIISCSDGYEPVIQTAMKHIEEIYEMYR